MVLKQCAKCWVQEACQPKVAFFATQAALLYQYRSAVQRDGWVSSWGVFAVKQ